MKAAPQREQFFRLGEAAKGRKVDIFLQSDPLDAIKSVRQNGACEPNLRTAVTVEMRSLDHSI